MADAVALRACTNKRHRIDFVSGCPVDSYSDPAVRFDSFKRSFVLDHVSRTELEVRGRHFRRDAKRQNAHADQVRAMDAFEASCGYGPNPKQSDTLGRPVARGSHAVALTGDDHGRSAFARKTLGRAPQRQLFSRSGVDGRARRNTGREQVLHGLIGYCGDSALIQSDRRPLA